MRPAEIGIYGLGTMGRALALNFAEQGTRVAVTNREVDWIAPFIAEAGPLSEQLTASETLGAFMASLETPRLILFMIPSGPPLDAVLEEVQPLLSAGDTVIDGGNADFHDTRRRSAAFEEVGLHFVGMGVSGGEKGARNGPSLMVGGSAESWTRLAPHVTRIAARFDGDPCVAHLGTDGAGHFVKTVHNGIEYADMQMLAEVYGLMRDGFGQDAQAIGAVMETWRGGALESYLLDTTVLALSATDPETGQPMVDVIRDTAGQKGTGRWTVIEALKLGQSVSVINAAVDARNWSSQAQTRARGAEVFAAVTETAAQAQNLPDQVLEDALRAGRMIAHAQGFALLETASQSYDWQLDKARIAEIWRAGCIIRSALLDDVAEAFHADRTLDSLIFAPNMRDALVKTVPALRAFVSSAVAAGVAVPALSAALAWFDSMTRAVGTANIIQAQRDIFGRHGFERRDRPGKVNADWEV